jgi:hypothetical protein
MPAPSPDDRVIVVWMNPDHSRKPQSRLLVTLTSSKTGLPLAFSSISMRNSPIFHEICPSSPSSLLDDLVTSTPAKPALIPTILAEIQLGWTDFTPAEEPEA